MGIENTFEQRGIAQEKRQAKKGQTKKFPLPPFL
jgi:hypothetical protein